MSNYQSTIDVAYPEEDASLLERESGNEFSFSAYKSLVVKNRKTLAILAAGCAFFGAFNVNVTPKFMASNEASTSLLTTSQPYINVCVREKDENGNLVSSVGAFVDCWDDDGANGDDHMGNQFTGDNGCARVTYDDISWDNIPSLLSNAWRADIYCLVSKSGHFNNKKTAQHDNWDPSRPLNLSIDE